MGTTATAALVLPPHAVAARLPIRSVPVGDNLLARLETVFWDPHALYKVLLRSLNVAVIGDVGHGKSGVMKTTLRRLLTLPVRNDDGSLRRRRAVFVDLKGEYRRLTEGMRCTPVVLGHGVCMNPCDPALSSQQQLAVLESFLRLLLDRGLTSFEKECLAGAYDQAVSNAEIGKPLVLDDVRHALMHLPDEFVGESLHTRVEVDHTASELAFALKQLITGSLRGMFNGPTTATLDWSAQAIDIIVHPEYRTANRELVYQLLVVLVAVWLDRAWQHVDADRRIDYFVIDEAWDAAKVRQFAELLQDATKLGRSRGLAVFMAFHGPSDVESAGNAGEAQVQIAKRALKEMGTYFLFHMNREDAEILAETIKLDEVDVEVITELEPHQFLLVVGSGTARRRFLVRHQITEEELAMVDTDPEAA